MNFDSYKAVKIIAGRGEVKKNAALLASFGKKAMIVSGRTSADRCGAMADVAEALKEAGCTYVRAIGVPENPPADMCHAWGETCRKEGCDFVIAIGGGSAMDGAKAIAAYATNPQCDVMDLFDDEKRTEKGLPLIAIPTTAGTGSEANRYSVLTVDGGRRKMTFKHATSYPSLALVCPEYTDTMNETYTVSTALDALAHGIESYFSPHSSPLSEEMALFAVREIWDVLFREGIDGGVTSRQRDRLAYGATAAGIAIDYTGTGFPHPLGYGITLAKGIPHGAACALFEGAFLRYNMLSAEGRKRARLLAEAAGTTEEEMMELIPEKSGVHLRLDREEMEELIDRVSGAGNFANSPYVISRGEMSDIYRRIFA